MKNFNYFLLFVVAPFAFACSSSDDDEPNLKEKEVTIEIEMGGNYTDYLVVFSAHSMLRGTSTFVAPQLVQPSGLEWTQIVDQANSYTVSYEPTVNNLQVQSASKIHSFGFLFNAVPLEGEQDDSFQPLTATVRILTDGSVYKEYTYEALPPGQTSIPLSEEITIE